MISLYNRNLIAELDEAYTAIKKIGRKNLTKRQSQVRGNIFMARYRNYTTRARVRALEDFNRHFTEVTGVFIDVSEVKANLPKNFVAW